MAFLWDARRALLDITSCGDNFFVDGLFLHYDVISLL